MTFQSWLGLVFCDLAWVFEGDDGEIDASHHKHVNLYGLSHGISMLMDNAGIQLQLTGMRIELASSENPRTHPIRRVHTKRLEQFQHLFTVAVNHGNLRLGNTVDGIKIGTKYSYLCTRTRRVFVSCDLGCRCTLCICHQRMAQEQCRGIAQQGHWP